ncbi:MAG: hypothetical protein AAFU60_18880 [Bacteroidota bacterium]
MFKKPFWNSDKVLSLSDILVSLCTLIVFTYQTTLIRKQQYMSVYPHLDMGHYYTYTVNYKYILANSGLGPARILEVDIEDHTGQKFDAVEEYLYSKITEEDTVFFYNSGLYPGRLIKAEEELALIGLLDKEMSEPLGIPDASIYMAARISELLSGDSVTINVVYESIYGEKWRASNQFNVPTEL